MTEQNAALLEPVYESDLGSFCDLMDEAFSASETATSHPDPHARKEVGQLFEKENRYVMWVLENGSRVGGAVVEIEAEAGRSLLVWFFIVPNLHGRGLGTRAWRAIERQWPETIVWEVGTSYHDKRKVNSYINKCGFQVVEFFNEHHPGAREEDADDSAMDPWPEDSFRFEKTMRQRDE